MELPFCYYDYFFDLEGELGVDLAFMPDYTKTKQFTPLWNSLIFALSLESSLLYKLVLLSNSKNIDSIASKENTETLIVLVHAIVF